MAYNQAYVDSFIYTEMMRDASGDPQAPEPTDAVPAPAPVQTGVAPAPQLWNKDVKIASFSDGSQLAQLGGKDVTKLRWGMAKAYATKLAPSLKTGGITTMHENVRLEALDPRHRMGEMLGTMMTDFRKYTPPSFHSKLSLFFLWVDGFCRDEPDLVIETLLKAYGPDARGMVEDFVRGGVAYKEKAEDRKPYLLTFNGGRIYRERVPFDTRKCFTAHSGPGWAIYVVSPRGQWFAGSHRVGAFHHSTFLAGRPVLSAGEMQASDGYITLLTAKSGHYQPSMEQFVNGLKSLRRAGVSLDRCQVEVYSGRKAVRLGAVPFMINGHLQKQHTVWT